MKLQTTPAAQTEGLTDDEINDGWIVVVAPPASEQPEHADTDWQDAQAVRKLFCELNVEKLETRIKAAEEKLRVAKWSRDSSAEGHAFRIKRAEEELQLKKKDLEAHKLARKLKKNGGDGK